MMGNKAIWVGFGIGVLILLIMPNGRGIINNAITAV